MTENKSTEDLCREEKISELEILKQSIEEQKKIVQDYYNQLLHSKADFENYRKRVEKERKEIYEDGKSALILELVDVFETVKIAKNMIETAQNNESIREGLHLIEKKLQETLSYHKVDKIQTIGEKFDPLFHDVIGVVEKEDCEDDIIVEEIKSGYKIGNRILKPSMVKICKKKAS
ncbi:MAG: nucleotide exchange factor GrpE [Elusimicrobia bacterium RIFOXYD2_FULL_34_15]|nr:MAG: nucleotide exchange factor GrpE [Elusimicrobia bacterium RIFOXYD2_FULL_34_15]